MLALGLVLAASTGCDSDDGDQQRAEPAKTSPSASGTGTADARGPVRLLRLGNFDAPTYITSPRGDRRRFVVQRGGTIVVLNGRKKLSEPFLDISSMVSGDGEEGLLSMVFSPNYKSSGIFYVYYTDREGFIQIDQYRRSSDPDRADPSSRRSVIRVPHHRTNHKGGQLQFGSDGLLYAGFGDGGGGRRSRRERPEPRPHARQADQDRSAPRRRLPHSALEPVRAPQRRPGGDLRLRPAQPLPVLVRPQAREPRHRRRRPGRGRGGRLHPGPPRRAAAARRLQLRLGRVRGAQPLRGRAAHRGASGR